MGLKFLAILIFSMVADGQVTFDTPGVNGDGMQKMSFTPPQLSEEDQYAIHMPEYLKCDGCMAVSFTLHKAFEDKHKNIKDEIWRMDDGDVIEIFGMHYKNICTQTF